MPKDPDWPGPSDATAFVDSAFQRTCEAVAGLPILVAGERFRVIGERFEAGLIERFNFTSEQAANAAGQKVTVEHVHVHAGGQAVVGVVEPAGGGDRAKSQDQPHAKQIAMHRSLRCGARTRRGNSCLSPAMANGRCRMHGGKGPGAARGNNNALKHGRYTAEAIAERRHLMALLRDMKGLAEQVDGDE